MGIHRHMLSPSLEDGTRGLETDWSSGTLRHLPSVGTQSSRYDGAAHTAGDMANGTIETTVEDIRRHTGSVFGP